MEHTLFHTLFRNHKSKTMELWNYNTTATERRTTNTTKPKLWLTINYTWNESFRQTANGWIYELVKGIWFSFPFCSFIHVHSLVLLSFTFVLCLPSLCVLRSSVCRMSFVYPFATVIRLDGFCIFSLDNMHVRSILYYFVAPNNLICECELCIRQFPLVQLLWIFAWIHECCVCVNAWAANVFWLSTANLPRFRVIFSFSPFLQRKWEFFTTCTSEFIPNIRKIPGKFEFSPDKIITWKFNADDSHYEKHKHPWNIFGGPDQKCVWFRIQNDYCAPTLYSISFPCETENNIHVIEWLCEMATIHAIYQVVSRVCKVLVRSIIDGVTLFCH